MEILFSVIFFIVVFSMFIQAIDLNLILPNGAFAAGFFPVVISVILLLLILGFLILVIKKIKNASNEKNNISMNVLKRQIFLIASLFISIFLVKYVGMLIVLGLFLFVSSIFVENLTWKRSFVFSVAGATSIYLIFYVWLNFNLPIGILGI